MVTRLGLLIVAYVQMLAKKASMKAMEMSTAVLSEGMERRKTGEVLKRAKDGGSFWKHLRMHHGITIKIVGVTGTLICTWIVGGAMLFAAEPAVYEDGEQMQGFTFIQGFYCAVCTSLSIGFGDFSPSTQISRGLYIIYIPSAVVVVFGSIGQVISIMTAQRTVKVIEWDPITHILHVSKPLLS
jgi:hypothetical protein